MRKTSEPLSTLLLALILTLSLCACAQKMQTVTESDELKISNGADISSQKNDSKIPEKTSEKSNMQSGELLFEKAEVQSEQSQQSVFSEEAKQSLDLLRMRMNLPEVMFGAAYLGYTGEDFDGNRLSELNQAMLQKYPFILEIDEDHTIGTDNYLYCLLPLDENATVSINLVLWNAETENEEVIEVLYRSESGDPVLLFTDGSDDVYADEPCIQIQIVDNSGNSCEWYPQLDAMGQIVPCMSENEDYLLFDFTEYGWLTSPSELALWLSEGYSGVYATGIDGCWKTQAVAWNTDYTATYYLWFFSEDETGGSIDLDWQYEGSDLFEEMWSGSWTISTVIDGATYVTIKLSLVGGENYGVTDGPYYICETYPLLISPSGMELIFGTGLDGIRLPFMSKNNTQPCSLILDE